MTSLRLYELVMGPLADAERESYWQEARFFASELGATAGSLPATFADAARYEQDMLSRTVIPDATAREVARDVLHPFRWLPAWASCPLDAVTAGLLPEAPRTAFGLRWRRRERLFFRGVIVALRGSVPLLPERLRFVPQARRYAARAAEAGGVRMD